MQRYMIGLVSAAAGTEIIGTVQTEFFRPDKLFTNIAGPELASIDGVFLGDDPETQLLGPFDAWMCAVLFLEQMRAEFFKEHGLEGKSDPEIQRYLDGNDLSMPDVPRFVLRTLRKGERIRVTGKFPAGFAMSIVGDAP